MWQVGDRLSTPAPRHISQSSLCGAGAIRVGRVAAFHAEFERVLKMIVGLNFSAEGLERQAEVDMILKVIALGNGSFEVTERLCIVFPFIVHASQRACDARVVWIYFKFLRVAGQGGIKLPQFF